MAGNDKYKCPSATLHQIAQNKWKIFHEQQNNDARKERITVKSVIDMIYNQNHQYFPK